MLKAYMAREASSTSPSTKPPKSIDSSNTRTRPATSTSALADSLDSSRTAPNLGLHAAATSGNLALVKYALENGQPINCVLSGVTPLHAAATTGDTDMITFLIANGADVNAMRLKDRPATPSRQAPGAEGSTPLHFAAANGHVDVVRVLLEYGAIPSAADTDGNVPASLAATIGHFDCAETISTWIKMYGPTGLADLLPNTSADRSAHSITPTSSAPQSPVRVPTSVRAQKSLDQLSSAAAGVKASLRNKRSNSRMNKMPSNPLLRNSTTSSNNGGQNSASTMPASTSSLGDRISRIRAGSLGDAAPEADVTGGLSSGGMLTEESDTNEDEDADIGFSTSTTPRPGALGSSESKRRPSLPSIFEKATHPANSIKAALASNALKANTIWQDPTEEANSANVAPASRTVGRLTGKRSLSNLLRRATGGLSHSESNPNLKTAALEGAGSSRHDAAAAAAFAQLPLSATKRADPATFVIAPSSAGATAVAPSVMPSQATHGGSDDVAMVRPLVKDSGHKPTIRPRKSSHPSSATAPSSHARVPPLPSVEVSHESFTPVEALETSDAALPMPPTSPQSEVAVQQRSDGHAYPQGGRKRAQSTASATARRQTVHQGQSPLPTSPTLPMNLASPGLWRSQDSREVLGEPLPQKRQPLVAARQRPKDDEAHLLPEGLRSLRPMRDSPKMHGNRPLGNGIAVVSETSGNVRRGTGHASGDSSSTAIFGAPHRLDHKSSASSLSTASYTSGGGEFSGDATIRSTSGSAQASIDNRPPRRSVSTLSEDRMRAAGAVTASRNQGRLTSRPSNSSIRSVSVGSSSGSAAPSAAEQAQAIMRNADLYSHGTLGVGEDGKPVTLAAQLAAYGEALAKEQNRSLRPSNSTPSTPLSMTISLTGSSPPPASTSAYHVGRARSGSGSSAVPPHVLNSIKGKVIRHESSRDTLSSQGARQLPSVREDLYGSETDEEAAELAEKGRVTAATSPSVSGGSTSTSSSTVPSTVEGASDTTMTTTPSSDTVTLSKAATPTKGATPMRPLHLSRSSGVLSATSQRLQSQASVGNKMPASLIATKTGLTTGRLRASSDDNRSQGYLPTR